MKKITVFLLSLFLVTGFAADQPTPPQNGGTGVNNSSTITVGGNINTASSLTTSGANPLTLTTTGTTNSTLPAGTTTLAPTTGTGATGTWGISISGNAATATSSTSTATATNANNINTTVSSANSSFYLPFVGSSSSGYQALNINSNLSYNPLSGVLTLPNITLTAPSANQLLGLNVGNSLVGIGAGTSTTLLHGNASGLPTYSAVSLTADVTGTLPNSNTTATNANTASAIVARDASGNFSAGTITAALSGNASTATNGVVTTGSYADPAWITSLAASKLTGTVSVASGGTGQSTYTNGQILIGNTTGNTLAKATLTGTTNRVTVTNGAGSITLSGPQDIAAGSSPTFNGLTLSSLNTAGAVINDGSGVLSSLPYTSSSVATYLVQRDGSGNFSAGVITAALNGTASFALAASTADNSHTTSNSSNTTFYVPFAALSSTSYQDLNVNSNLNYNPSLGSLTTSALTLSGLTNRSVLYSGSSGAVSQDNSNFVYDSAAHNLFLGTNSIASPNAVGRLNILGTDSTIGASQAFYTSTDFNPLFQILPFTHDNTSLNFDAYYNAGWVSSSSNSSFQIAKIPTALQLNYAVGTAGTTIAWSTGISLSSTGAVSIPGLTLSSTALASIPAPTVTVFNGTASGNYTPPAGCTHFIVQGWGPGGGGGGVAGTASNSAGAGGGGSGGMFKSLISAPFSAPYAYGVGSSGAGGFAGANNGNAGTGPTTFGSFSAGAGGGGTSATASLTAGIAASGTGGAVSGAAQLSIAGESGINGLQMSGTVAFGGAGGNAPQGGSGGRPGLNGAGGNGSGPGAGGAGATSTNATSRAGGNGVDGKLLIYEYYN